MVTRKLISGICLIVGLVLLLFYSGVTEPSRRPSQVQATKDESSFLKIYTKSVENLSQPDLSFAELPVDRPRENVGQLVLATSTTCSRRCSQRCSQGCTTTRGCSTRCKTYTEGCTGTGGTDNTQTSRVNRDSIPVGSIPRVRVDIGNTYHLQMLLRVAGYDLTLSGTLDEQTYAAIIDFQKRNGLSETGVPDSNLWRTLCLALANAVK